MGFAGSRNERSDLKLLIEHCWTWAMLGRWWWEVQREKGVLWAFLKMRRAVRKRSVKMEMRNRLEDVDRRRDASACDGCGDGDDVVGRETPFSSLMIW